MIMSIKQKEVKFKPRIKLNHIICVMYAEKLKKQWKDGKSCSLRICCLGPPRKSYLFGINLLFAICTSHQNTPCPTNFCITLVFDFPWVFQWSQKKLKRMYYGRCANGELTTLVWSRWLDNGLVLFCVLTELTFTTCTLSSVPRVL